MRYKMQYYKKFNVKKYKETNSNLQKELKKTLKCMNQVKNINQNNKLMKSALQILRLYINQNFAFKDDCHEKSLYQNDRL